MSKSRMRTSAPRSVALAVVYLFLGGTLLTLRNEFSFRFPTLGSFFFSGVAFGLLAVGGGMLLYLYLRGDVDLPFLSRFVKMEPPTNTVDFAAAVYSEIERLWVKFDEIKREFEQKMIGSGQLTPEEKNSLIEVLKLQLQGVVATDIVKQIESKYASKISEDAQIAQIRRSFDLTSQRLRQEVASLSRRNSLNLTIGAITTVLAGGMLAYLVLGATLTFNNIPDLLAHFIPRVSVAAFIEVFSFFFLRLYKSGLQEIKYFQNELTNIEMKGVALEAALLAARNKTTEQIVEQLIRTDRNLATSAMIASPSGDGKQLSPKDLGDLLEKVGKLLNVGGGK